MSTTQNPDDDSNDLTEAVEDQLVAFARNARVDARNRNGGALNNAMTMANMEILDTLDLSEGMLQDPSNVIAIVFDETLVPDMYLEIQDGITEPCTGVEIDTFDSDKHGEIEYARFEFEPGHTACIQTDYLEHIEEVYGVNPIETPEVVLGHPEYETYPIRVDSDGSHIIIAPILVDGW